MPYNFRCVDSQLERSLTVSGGVLLRGPRGCGKTSTAAQKAKSQIRLDSSPEAAQLAIDAPQVALAGTVPRLVDEWQLAPSIWNSARHEIDDRQIPGQFIFCGSATPPQDPTRHSGAGRFARIQMRTMSLSESGLSTNTISLSSLMNKKVSTVGAASQKSYVDLAEIAVRGGWPGILAAKLDSCQEFNADYLENLYDIGQITGDGRGRDPERIRRLLAILSRCLGGEMNVSRLAKEVGSDGRPTSEKTIRSDLDELKAAFIYDPLPAWSVDVRSRTRLRGMEKIHLADPALALAALNVGPEKLALQRQYFGFVFESMAIRDLRTYSAIDRGRLYHYRDDSNLEIDAIIDYGDKWAAIEIKLGGSEISKAETSLLRLAQKKVDTSKIGEPAFLAIVTGTEYAYTLPSGIHVIPLATLTW